ncbi:SDR family oxidoreductase [Terrarubrum flagellatum]|uniref:SDR family NAD(P)-dependent oxidoreductase n=1 Tax=Terrirubrum flagellatum TaxID=2895980 RepID=UPI003144D901
MPVSSQDRGAAPIAVVTGGAGGIGEATAKLLCEEGWIVVIADKDADRAEIVARELGAYAAPMDIADEASVDAAATWVERNVGPCCGLVACAAHLENPHRPEAQDMAEFDRVLSVNLRGTFLTMTRFGAAMVARKRGSIVTIGSITAMNSSPLVAYGPSKAGIIAMTRDFAGAWGRRGIRVNCVCPGPTRTPAVEASYARGERDPALMTAQTALGHLVDPRDVAEAVAFLLSDRARSITGITLPVDAGTLTTQLWALYGGIPG